MTFAFVRALGEIYELAEPTEGLDNTRKRRFVSFTLASGWQHSNQSSKIDDFQQLPASIDSEGYGMLEGIRQATVRKPTPRTHEPGRIRRDFQERCLKVSNTLKNRGMTTVYHRLFRTEKAAVV